MSYSAKVLKHGKLGMDSPVQDSDARGGRVEGGAKVPTFGKTEGKGSKKHLAMEGPDLAGGGWVSGSAKKGK
jgi:hypothetical protein